MKNLYPFLRSFFLLAVPVTFGLMLSGCANEADEAAPNQDHQAVRAECPEQADECPASCNAFTALRFDVERGCREQSETVLGCAAPFEQSSDAACFRRVSDGSVWIGSSSAFPQPAFERCEGALLKAVAEGDGGLCE